MGVHERLIAGSALLYTVLLILPWYAFDDEGLEDVDASTNGFNDTIGFGPFTFEVGYATWPALLTWLLLLASAVWVLLPAFTTVRAPVSPGLLTAGVGFSIVAFLALLTVLAAAVLAALRLLPELAAQEAAGSQSPCARPVGEQPPQGYVQAPQQPSYPHQQSYQQPYQGQQPPPGPPSAPGPA